MIRFSTEDSVVKREFFVGVSRDFTDGERADVLTGEEMEECHEVAQAAIDLNTFPISEARHAHPIEFGYWVTLSYESLDEAMANYTVDRNNIRKVYEATFREHQKTIHRRQWHQERADAIEGEILGIEDSPEISALRNEMERHLARVQELTP